MHDPNSFIVRFRRWLARILNVRPDPGEGWCIGCALNGGRTKIISVEGLREHVELHPPTDYVIVETMRENLPEERPL
jgi:hypothetical protein